MLRSSDSRMSQVQQEGLLHEAHGKQVGEEADAIPVSQLQRFVRFSIFFKTHPITFLGERKMPKIGCFSKLHAFNVSPIGADGPMCFLDIQSLTFFKLNTFSFHVFVSFIDA